MRRPSPPARPLCSRAVCAWLLLGFLLAAIVPARAQRVQVVAGFTPSNVTEVGARLQFYVKVAGAEQAQLPKINVDGLEFDYVGPENYFSFNGRTASTSVKHVFEVTTLRPGDFTIPPIEISADGQRVRTQPVALKVLPAGSDRPSRSGTAPMEITVVPEKMTAYVGEVIPLEVRITCDAQLDPRPESLPELDGEGFTKPRFDGGRQSSITQNGRQYEVMHFRTLISPVRAGRVSVGPAKISLIISPAIRNDDDDFSIFRNFMRGFGERQRRVLSSAAAEMTIKPLPAAGKPKSFGGAVGQFAMALGPTPDHVKINDPLTLKFTVTGSGNFERLTAPVLTQPQGWRVYPPTESLKKDAADTTGTKTYEMAVVPETKQTHLPIFELAYFDPAAEKYVTLKSPASALKVEGEPAPLPPPQAQLQLSRTPPSAAPAPRPAATPAPAAAPNDILSIRYDAERPHSVRPLYEMPAFWAAQLVPAAVLGGLLARRFRRPGAKDGRRQAAAWRRERAELLSRLRREKDRQAFYDTAARILQLEAALRTGREPDTIDAALVRRMAPGESSSVLTEIFETRAEALYAGGRGDGGQVSTPERERILDAVALWQKATA